MKTDDRLCRLPRGPAVWGPEPANVLTAALEEGDPSPALLATGYALPPPKAFFGALPPTNQQGTMGAILQAWPMVEAEQLNPAARGETEATVIHHSRLKALRISELLTATPENTPHRFPAPGVITSQGSTWKIGQGTHRYQIWGFYFLSSLERTHSKPPKAPADF